MVRCITIIIISVVAAAAAAMCIVYVYLNFMSTTRFIQLLFSYSIS